MQTLLEAILGLAIAVALGAVVALALDAWPLFRRAVYPLLITSQTIPMIALAPLLLVWLGFDLTPKLVIVVLYCFFPVTIALAGGLASVDRGHVDLMHSMRATYLQTLWHLKLPSALPAFFSGLKIAVTYAMTAAIVGEYVGAYQGLGVYIQTSANSHAVPVVFAAIFVTAALSVALFGLATLAEHLLVPWRHKK
jgi:ABC-type nitrate/sulfonate/bicarbonate transport system permease component